MVLRVSGTLSRAVCFACSLQVDGAGNTGPTDSAAVVVDTVRPRLRIAQDTLPRYVKANGQGVQVWCLAWAPGVGTACRGALFFWGGGGVVGEIWETWPP